MSNDLTNNVNLNNLSLMQRVRAVLVRPQIAGNIGAVARLMENFNGGQLVLVDPAASPQSQEAMRRSTHGQERLTQARVVDTLEQAMDGVVYAFGASRRRGPAHQTEDLVPRQMAAEVCDYLPKGDVALLFGAEDNGLSREHLIHCDKVVQIPAQPDYGTLNLSHAVAVCLYEVFIAVVGEQLNELATGDRSELADRAMMARLMDKLQQSLLTIGYLRPEKPDHLMFPIRAILSRANLTHAEARTLMGLAQRIDEFAKYGK